MLTVGMHGQVLSVRTPGCLRRIPASQAGGAPALLIMKKGTCIQWLRIRHARLRTPHLLSHSQSPGYGRPLHTSGCSSPRT